jgi:integrase/recombinase XerD
MTELRRRMIRDMNLAGFTAGTQRSYIHGVRQLAKHYMLSPDRLTEKQVEDYVFYLREEKKVAKGTFQEYFYAIRFLYVNTLNYDWALFTKKKYANLVRSDCPTPAAAPTAAL